MAIPDPQIVRELATEHILDDARRAHDIGAAVLGHHGPDALTKHEYGAWCSAVRDAIRTATVAVSWPDEQPAAEQAAPDCAAVEAAVRDLGELATAWLDWFDGDQDWDPPVSMPERRSEIADHLRQVRTILAELERLGRVEQERESAAADLHTIRDVLTAWHDVDTIEDDRYLRQTLIVLDDRFGERVERLAADLAARDEREAQA